MQYYSIYAGIINVKYLGHSSNYISFLIIKFSLLVIQYI